MLYGGYPCKDLKHKFLLAKSSIAKDFSDEALADCLSSRDTLDKYQIGFVYDMAQYLETLERIKSIKGKMFVPAHAPATDNITELADYNINKVHEIAEKILSLCGGPICFEHILQRLFFDYSLTINFEQYVLVGSTVRSYLS